MPERRPLEGLSPVVRPADHGLQPLQPLVWVQAMALDIALAAGQMIPGSAVMEGSHVKARRCAYGGKERARRKLPAFPEGPGQKGPSPDRYPWPLVAMNVTAGNVKDITMAEALLAEVEDCRYVLADKGYNAYILRAKIEETSAKLVTPGRKSREKPIRFDKIMYIFQGIVEAIACGRLSRCASSINAERGGCRLTPQVSVVSGSGS